MNELLTEQKVSFDTFLSSFKETLIDVFYRKDKIEKFIQKKRFPSPGAEASGIENDLSGASIEVNSMKAYVTDLMQESAQIATQLSGGNGYKAESMGARAIMDSRPFQIFEGSNEMLYTQIYEMVFKQMARLKTVNLSSFLMKYELTKNAAEYFKSMLNFSVDVKTPQRKMIDLGKAISRVISVNQLLELANKGFREDLIRSSIESIGHEISMLVASYQFEISVTPIEEYKDGGNWLNY